MLRLRENTMLSRTARFLEGGIIMIIIITIMIVMIIMLITMIMIIIIIISINIITRLGVGKAFGELAILYNCKRTASVKAIEVFHCHC